MTKRHVEYVERGIITSEIKPQRSSWKLSIVKVTYSFSLLTSLMLI